jgi:uncharacterized protein YbjT (DUF2867 family)
MNILVTGANGFVGSQLVDKLLKEGHKVFALVRSLDKEIHLDKKNLTYLAGDLLKPSELPQLPEIEKAYFLVHGLKGNSHSFEYEEASMAVNFIDWVKIYKPDIIYLGGIAPRDVDLSPHLRARVLTGKILGISGLNVIELRASIILGAGSLSFEMIKAMSERLPFRPDLHLLDRSCQPLSLTDLIQYLVVSLDLGIRGHEIIEIGGEEISTYGELMDLYSNLSGLKRKKIKLPEVEVKVLMKALDYVVPEYSQVGKKLTESLEHPTIVTNAKAVEIFPAIKPLKLKQAMTKAKENSHSHYPTLWNKDFLKTLLSDKLLTQSGLISPDLLRHLEKVGKIKDIFTRKSHD